MKTTSVVIIIFFCSCQIKRNLSQEECETLSLKAYKGFPKALNDFNTHCKKYTIRYTKEYCQNAFEGLILGTDAATLKDRYGQRVLECFSEKEKARFLKNP